MRIRRRSSLRGAQRRGNLFIAVALLLLSACANYSSRVREPLLWIDSGQYDLAINSLKELADKKDNDELLYLMDLGTSYHLAGRYQEAIDVFHRAEKLAAVRDYTSLTEEAGSVLLSDEVVKYKGEDFEKLLINVYLAIDYTLLGKYEDAVVEARRVNHKLDIMISKGKEPYEQNAFAKYLAAMLFEARDEYNDAFVDYRQLLKWRGKENPDYLAVPLLRLADRLKFTQEFEDYQKRFKGTKDYRLGKNEGEVVLLLENGKAPLKQPSENFRLVPVFRKRYYGSQYAWFGSGTKRVRTYPLFDIEGTAIKELDNRMAGIIAKKVGGVVVKEVAAAAVEKATDSELAGLMTRVFLHATDSADTRSWSTLPSALQVARLTLPAGRHDIRLDMVRSVGGEQKGTKLWSGIDVKPGSTQFLHYRYKD